MVTTRSLLKPVELHDHEFLRTVEGFELGPTWRNRGTSFSPESFDQAVWAGVLAQYLVMRRSDNAPVGWVRAYNANHLNGFAYIAIARVASDGEPDLAFGEGVARFVSNLFAGMNFRRLYAEVAGYNVGKTETGLESIAETVAIIPDHLVYDGELWDERILLIDRDAWKSSPFSQI